jgi:hypothetical protein
MNPDEAEAAIRAEAGAFASRSADVREMWAAFQSNLHALCRDAPLNGDFLEMFNALEAWEAATGDGRESAVESARAIARRLSSQG